MAFDFTAVTAPFRMQPGLRRLAPGEPQLTANRPGYPALAEKLVVLQQHAHQALLVLPGFDAQPALRSLIAHAAAEHPEALHADGDDALHARWLGWSVREGQVDGDGPAAIGACLQALPAHWRAAALLALAFADDFAVIDARGLIPWLAVCLPSHWAPEDKIGRHFAQVHAPVADNQTLIAASDHLARLVTGPERWQRFVWTITRHPRLNQHPHRCDPAPWPSGASSDELAARAFFRTERQTFIPVTGTGDTAQAVFTIHVGMQPLASAISQPAHARLLHDALASMSAAVLAYRGLTDARDRLLHWLAQRAAASA